MDCGICGGCTGGREARRSMLGLDVKELTLFCKQQ